MNWDMWRKYLLLMAAVVLCAGAVWYFSENGEQPQGDAVLASARPGSIVEAGNEQESEEMVYAFTQSGSIAGVGNGQESEEMVYAFTQSGSIAGSRGGAGQEKMIYAFAQPHAEYREVQDI